MPTFNPNDLDTPNPPYPDPTLIEALFRDLTVSDLKDIAIHNPSFRGYLQGYIAERKLQAQLLTLPGVESVSKIRDQAPEKGDLKVVYRSVPITIELKSLQTASIRHDPIHDSWEGTVMVKNGDRREIITPDGKHFVTTNLIKGGFDVLGICCLAVNGEWEFQFMESRFLPEHDSIQGLIRTTFQVHPLNTPCLTSSPLRVLESVYRLKTNSSKHAKIEESDIPYFPDYE
jgi:hypothetical protein